LGDLDDDFLALFQQVRNGRLGAALRRHLARTLAFPFPLRCGSRRSCSGGLTVGAGLRVALRFSSAIAVSALAAPAAASPARNAVRETAPALAHFRGTGGRFGGSGFFPASGLFSGFDCVVRGGFVSREFV